MQSVAECFCSALPRSGKCAGEIAKTKTGLQRGASNILMEKTCIKTIARADCVHGLRWKRFGDNFHVTASCHGSLFAALHHDERHSLSKFSECRSRSGALRKTTSFMLVRQQRVEICEDVRPA